jgi:hypothetical protein
MECLRPDLIKLITLPFQKPGQQAKPGFTKSRRTTQEQLWLLLSDI